MEIAKAEMEMEAAEAVSEPADGEDFKEGLDEDWERMLAARKARKASDGAGAAMGGPSMSHVDPLDPLDLAAAIDEIHADKNRAAEMGRNGSKAALVKYNWGVEEVKLIGFYREMLGKSS